MQMDLATKTAKITELLKRIAPGHAVESVARPRRALLESLGADSGAGPDEHARTIDSGLQKLAANQTERITPAEIDVLEAIVLPQNRPVVFVNNDSYDPLDEPWTQLNDPSTKQRLGALLPLIGRIEIPGSVLVPYAGTGFVVGRNRLMTNRHVAKLFSSGVGQKILYRAGEAAVDFKREVNSPPNGHSSWVTVRSVEMVHPYWDMAILQVEGLPTRNVLNLSILRPEELVGRDVVAVGYPAKD